MTARDRAGFPVVASLLVAAAVAVMVALGFWQIARLHQKEAKLARYSAAQAAPGDVPWPDDARAGEAALYRRAQLSCAGVGAISARAGRSADGRSGWAHTADCRLAGGQVISVVLGWSNGPQAAPWAGGVVRGYVAPGEHGHPRLIADPPLGGLAANARPDPRDLPNNHLSYAVQWFLFAGTALVIYAIAVRRRLARPDPRR